MKWFLLVLALGITSLPAQQNELQSEAVRAFQAGDYTSARSLFESVLALDPKNSAAQNYLRIIAQKEKGEGGGLEAGLRRVILSQVNLRETTPREAFTYISQQVEKQSGGKQKLNIVWMVPAGQEEKHARPVTLSLQNAPATEALRYIASMAGLQISYDQYAVKVKPETAQ